MALVAQGDVPATSMSEDHPLSVSVVQAVKATRALR